MDQRLLILVDMLGTFVIGGAAAAKERQIDCFGVVAALAESTSS